MIEFSNLFIKPTNNENASFNKPKLQKPTFEYFTQNQNINSQNEIMQKINNYTLKTKNKLLLDQNWFWFNKCNITIFNRYILDIFGTVISIHSNKLKQVLYGFKSTAGLNFKIENFNLEKKLSNNDIEQNILKILDTISKKSPQIIFKIAIQCSDNIKTFKIQRGQITKIVN